jgi:lycopene cyclase domain-containing protein
VGIHKVLLEETRLKEYTVASIVSVLATVLIDRVLGTKVSGRAEFWVFISVMLVFTMIVNGYLTWRPVVLYGSAFMLNARILTIPVEDFLFGFSLVGLSVILWEYFQKEA